jgi:hypothetical protein
MGHFPKAECGTLIFDVPNSKQNRRVSARQPTYFCPAAKVSKRAFSSQRAYSFAWFQCFYGLLSMGSGPVQGGLSAVLSCSVKINHTEKAKRY